MTLVAYDFETEEIKDYPQYPPKPVGISIYEKGGTPHYYAWGHPTGNNCTEDEAIQAISKYWHSAEYELVAWNSPFDRLICHVHWGLPLNSAAKQHDGLVLAFLLDPHARELGLKPVAEKELGLPPEERDAVKDWLVSNGVCKDSKRAWGAHISKAPGDLVGKYADGDTLRTLQLFELQYKKIVDSGMLRAYEREMALQPIMLTASIEGIPVSAENLKRDIDMYTEALVRVDARIFELCGVGPFNINSAAQLADAIDRVVPGIVWPLTKTGRRSTSKATMEHVLGSLQGELLALLQYRASVNTCVNTFMKEWLRQATHPEGDGKIHCLWHTTRSDDGGARTGRLSSNPSFMNIPTLKSAKFAKCIELWEEHLKDLGIPGLPNVRYYIDTCNDDYAVAKRDFSSQELRVLAHYEDGPLLQAFKADPSLDLHQWACDKIKELTGIVITRKQAKTVAFSILYGSGLAKLAEGLHTDQDAARVIKDAYLDAIPGIAQLSTQLKARAKQGRPIRTWGGRQYYVEPPRFDPEEGRWRSFEYKMLNYLIQGSSADISKDAIIEYDAKKQHGTFLLMVHDELVIKVHKDHLASEMQILKECMESVPLDCPLTSEGEVGRNYHELELYND
jgi:DNA polymerase-1